MSRGWVTLPLRDRTECLNRKRVPVAKKHRSSGPYPYYGASGVVDYVSGYIFEGLHLLVAEDGENLRSRKSPVAFLAQGRFWVNNHAHVLQANEQNDLRYLAYAVEHSDVSGYITGSAQPKLSQGALQQIPITAPPLEEQRGIAATLGALDDKIDSNRRAIELMERHALLRFQKLFDVQHDPDGIAISDLVHVNRRHRMAKGLRATYVGMSSLPMFSPVIDEWVSKAAGSGQKFVNGDVLMARITPCLENGKTAIVDMLEGGEIGWGSTEYVVLSPRGGITTPWIYCLLRNVEVRSWAIRRMTGSSGRQRFSADGFKEYRVPRPTPDALGEFNQTANPMFSRMTQFRDESRKLEALRDALLPELLSGRIRVPEAAEAVASV